MMTKGKETYVSDRGHAKTDNSVNPEDYLRPFISERARAVLMKNIYDFLDYLRTHREDYARVFPNTKTKPDKDLYRDVVNRYLNETLPASNQLEEISDRTVQIPEALLIEKECPAGFGSVGRTIGEIKRIKDLEAISLELDSKFQIVLDKSFRNQKYLRVGDIGFYAAIVNYGTKNRIPSFATDELSLREKERVEYTLLKLKELNSKFGKIAHVCSVKQGELIETLSLVI